MLSGLKIPSLNLWLSNKTYVNEDKQYRLTLIWENTTVRKDALEELKALIRMAHDDAKYCLRKALRDTLDPLETWDDAKDPAEGYPEMLDLTTLKGYFGEIFSGIVAENFSPFDEKNWRVPVFPFRFHTTAFDQLEMYRQTGEINPTFGRTGDDCVAFVLDGDTIIKILFLEAKCTADHDTNMIADAHNKISSKNEKPVELLRIIEILKDHRNNPKVPDVDLWITALRKLYNSKDGFERYDCVSYVCGRSPKKPSDRISWISHEAPHPNYNGGRKLEAVEVHLTHIDNLIKDLYGKED